MLSGHSGSAAYKCGHYVSLEIFSRVHPDAERLRKEQKRARKEARQAQRVRSLEKLVLTGDLDNLTYSQKSGLKKHLSEERISELMEQRDMNAAQVASFRMFFS